MLAATALVLAVAGCGGGGSGGDSNNGGGSDRSSESGEAESKQAASLSKAEFIKQADAICASGRKQVEGEFAAYLKKNKVNPSSESPAETEAHETEVIETIAIPALRKQMGELKALGAPGGDEAAVEAFIDATEEGIEKGEEDPPSLFSSPQKVFAKSDSLARSYGFKVCGSRKA
jgi:hypothetical protein